MPIITTPVFILLLALALTVGCTGKSSEESIAIAEQYIAESRFDAATIELKNALQKDPGSAEARWLLGKNYLVTGDVESAAKELQRAMELGWYRGDVVPALARALLAQGAYVRVRELPTGGLNPGPQAEVMAVQALSEFAQGDIELANQMIQRALKLAPAATDVQIAEARILFARRDFTGALAATKEVLAASPDSAQAWSVSADVYMQQGEIEDALEAYDKAIEYQQYSPVDRLKRALIRLQLRDYDGALADAKILLAYSPDNPGGNYIRGVVQFQKGQYADALLPLSLAEPAWRKFPLVLFLLGSANLVQGNLEQAAGYASRFYDSFPDNVAGRKLLGTIRLKQRKFAAVQDLVSPVLDKYPDDVDALTLLANALLFDNRVDEGVAALEKVAQLQPDSAAARIRLGTGLILGGNSEAASEQLETALELDPQFQQAGILLILSHLQNTDYEAAIEAANTYRRRHPESAMSYNLLGKAYLENSQAGKARESFETAIRVNPGDPSASHQLARMALAEGEPATARRYYASVLEQYNNHLSTLIQLALLDAKEGNEEGVIENMERAMAAHPAALEPRLLLGRYYLSIGKPERLPPLFTTLANPQRRSPKVMLLLALSQISDADSAGAQYTLEEMMRSTPETPETHHLLAMAAAGTGDIARARSSLVSAVSLNPDFLPSRLALARLDLKAMDMEAFREQLAILVELAPGSADVLQLRAASAALDNKPGEAVDFSRAAFELAPATYTMLELAHYLKTAGDSSAAKRVMRKWIAGNPSDVAARLAVAGELRAMGLREESVAQYRSALESDPKNLIALTNLSWDLRHTNQKQSLAFAERANELAPDAPEVLDALAIAAYFNGDYQRAVRSIRRAMVRAPDNPGYRYHNALILSALGKTDGAVAALERLLAEGIEFPESGEAAQLLGKLRNRG